MNQVVFNIPEDLIVEEGVCAVICLKDGERVTRVLQISRVGEPPLWSQLGLLEAAADRAREHLKKAWS